MMWRKFAGRVNQSRIAGQECGLATAAAKVYLSLRTGSTRLRHPLGPTKPVEARGFFPDPGERLLADAIKNEFGYFPRGGARQNKTTGIDRKVFATPAIHARLRAAYEI